MADETGNAPPPRVNIAAGLATNPGNIEEFRGVLAAQDGPGRMAFSSAVKALENVQGSIADMNEAHRLMASALPEHRVIGRDGAVHYAVPPEKQAAVADAMSQSFRRGSKMLDDANNIIEQAAAQVETRINATLVNNHRNETSVATVAAQIRDLVKALPAAERVAFVRKAALEKDIEIVSAIFGASCFVSGLTRAQLADLKTDAEATFAPAEVAQRSALKAMRDRLATASGAYLSKYSAMVPRPNVAATKGAEALEKLRTGVPVAKTARQPGVGGMGG